MITLIKEWNVVAFTDIFCSQVSEIRSSLKYFTELVQSDKKGPNFVHLFSDRLNAVKRDLNTLSSQGENLKGSDPHFPFTYCFF
ncbi:hypothetical protein HPULCUR_007852 [Helicostylum pulchrum]|uniref:Uncharacterized protein n=1 Tax=Helicostylum pulchrum TaxID=562976 RepID=A0ABP9Y7V5_9FUNG